MLREEGAMTVEELNKPVSFPKWAEALADDSEIGAGRRDAFRRAIMGYLKHLKEHHGRASFASAKAYFDGEKEAGRECGEEREAVRCPTFNSQRSSLACEGESKTGMGSGARAGRPCYGKGRIEITPKA